MPPPNSIAYALERVRRTQPRPPPLSPLLLGARAPAPTSMVPDGWLGIGPEPGLAPEPEPEPEPNSTSASSASDTDSSSSSSSSVSESETEFDTSSESESESGPESESDSDAPPLEIPSTSTSRKPTTQAKPKDSSIPSAYAGYEGNDESMMAMMGLPTSFGTTNPAFASLEAQSSNAHTSPPQHQQPKSTSKSRARQKKKNRTRASIPDEHVTTSIPAAYDPAPIPPGGLPSNVTLKTVTLHMPQWQLPKSQRLYEVAGEYEEYAAEPDYPSKKRPRSSDVDTSPVGSNLKARRVQDDPPDLNYFPDETSADKPEAEEQQAYDGTEGWLEALPSWVRPHVVVDRQSIPENMHKYWYARYTLFNHFDDGYLLDRESWYSITPEAVANQITRRCAGMLWGERKRVHGAPAVTSEPEPAGNPLYPGMIIDGFCGAGGNVVSFARKFKHVVGIELDPVKVVLARHNARVAGVQGRVTVICADFVQWAQEYHRRRSASSGTEAAATNSVSASKKNALGEVEDWATWSQWKFDMVFLSPPWGGVSYQEAPTSNAVASATAAPQNVTLDYGPPDNAEEHPSTTDLSNDQFNFLPHTQDDAALVTITEAEQGQGKGENVQAEPALTEDSAALLAKAEQRVAELEAKLRDIEGGVETKHKRKNLRWKLKKARAETLALYDAVLADAPVQPSDQTVTHSKTVEQFAINTTADDSTYSLSRLTPLGGQELVQLCTTNLGTPNLALFLPRNSNWDDVGRLGMTAALHASDGLDQVLVEREVNGRKLVAITCYLGQLSRFDTPSS